MINPSEASSISSTPGSHPTQDSKTVIDYLMRENVSLKQEMESLKSEIIKLKTPSPKDNLLDKIVADSLLICGRVTDGIITEVDGKWKDILGYDDNQLVGHRYDRADLIHPDELKRVWRIQEKLKGTESITESRYCTIQRWKHGQTGEYVMLSMVWDVNVTENKAIVICKPIDRFIGGEGEFN
jgi:PAS domain-containing protein